MKTFFKWFITLFHKQHKQKFTTPSWITDEEENAFLEYGEECGDRD